MKKRFLSMLVVAGMMVASVTGCGGSQTVETDSSNKLEEVQTPVSQEAPASQETATTSVSGSLSLAGSTSMEKLCEALSESFMEKYPEVAVTVQYTGSGAGLESLCAGTVDIGNASRHLKDGEVANGAVENVVAIDGIAVIVDKANACTDITAEELAKIYTGEIVNWAEIGGADEAIVVIGREAGSGTRDAFEELLEVKDTCAYAQELDSTGAVLAKVASTEGAIGYVSLDVVDDSVSAVALDGISPTEENILAGAYLLSRPFVMATMGEIDAQNEVVKTWFDYISSEDGKQVISKIGLIIPN